MQPHAPRWGHLLLPDCFNAASARLPLLLALFGSIGAMGGASLPCLQSLATFIHLDFTFFCLTASRCWGLPLSMSTPRGGVGQIANKVVKIIKGCFVTLRTGGRESKSLKLFWTYLMEALFPFPFPSDPTTTLLI